MERRLRRERRHFHGSVSGRTPSKPDSHRSPWATHCVPVGNPHLLLMGQILIFPTSGQSMMHAHIVEMDDRGRILIPKKVRRSVKSTRFLLTLSSDRIELIPLDDPREAFRKLKGSRKLPLDWREAKEIAERLADEEVSS